MNTAPLNSIPLNGSSQPANCTGSGVLNGLALNEEALNGGGGCAPAAPAPTFTTGQAHAGLIARVFAADVATAGLRLRAFSSGHALTTLATQTSAPTGFAAFIPRLRLTASGVAVAGLRLSAGATLGTGSAVAPLALHRIALGTARTDGGSGGLAFNCYQPIIVSPPAPGSPPPSGSVGGAYYSFAVEVTVGNATLPATGTLEIDAEENGARTANLVIQGRAAADPGDTLIITLRVAGASTRLYRGTIDTLTYTPDADETRISCTDELQQYVDKLTNAQIDAITPGALTAPGTTSTGYAYLNHRLQTLTSSVYLAQDGSFTVKSWLPDDTRAITLDALISGSVSQARRDLAREQASGSSTPPKRREYLITMNLSWVRIAKAVVRNQWVDRFDFCTYLQSGSASLPQPQAIIDAVNNTGWKIDQLAINTVQPQSGWVSCGGAPFGVLVSGDAALAESATWQLYQRYTRSMSAKMTLRVIPATADPNAPVETTERSLSIKDPRDGKDWLDFGTGAVINQDANGDFYADLIDLGDANNQMGTALDPIRKEITDAAAQLAYELASTAARAATAQRGEQVSASTPIRPDLDIGQTLQIKHPKLTRTGVVSRVAHRIDIDAGSGITEVEIAPYTPTPVSTTPPDTANYPTTHVIRFDPFAPPDQLNKSLDIIALMNRSFAMGSGTGGGGILSQITTRKPPTPQEDVMSRDAQPRTYRGGTKDVVLPESDLWQGYVYNTPQSAIYVQGNGSPKFFAEYQNPGFFVRVPPINLPDQTDPIDLGESLVVI